MGRAGDDGGGEPPLGLQPTEAAAAVCLGHGGAWWQETAYISKGDGKPL